MSQHGTIKRYSLIIKKVTEDYFPSFTNIKSYLGSKGFEVSERTIQRDLKQIDQEFGLHISYSRTNKGYFIAEKDQVQLEPFIRFLEIVNTTDLLLESFSESKKTLQHISFDRNDKFTGLDWMKPILEALRENKVLIFSYQTFFEGPIKEFEIHPYLLKEYLNRWYLVGCFNSRKRLYIFGLDRIENLKITTTSFKPLQKLNPTEMFKDIIGLVSSVNKKQKIILSFTHEQGNYVKSLPLHRSQKILIDNDTELRIELNVIPNFELSQKILMHGSSVKVIKPTWLVNEIKENLTKALKQYQ